MRRAEREKPVAQSVPKPRVASATRVGQSQMTFVRLGAVSVLHTCLVTKYSRFDGRATNRELWVFLGLVLFAFVIASVLFMMLARWVSSGVTYDPKALTWVGCGLGIMAFLLALPVLAACVRRLHDSGHSGRLMWLALVPVAGTLLLLFYLTLPGQHRRNRYGAYQVMLH